MLHQPFKTSFYLLVISLLLFPSCKSKKNIVSKEVVETNNIEKYKDYTKGTVTGFAVDGCSFLITLENGERLNPVNLREDLKKDGLKVFVKYIPQKETMTVCMTGEVVKIIAIEKR